MTKRRDLPGKEPRSCLLPARYRGAAVAVRGRLLKADFAFTMQSRGGLRVEASRTLAVCAKRNASAPAAEVIPLLMKKENAVEGDA